MGNTYLKRVERATATRFWINNVTRNEATLSINEGAVGCTTNPSYSWRILNDSEDSAYGKELLAKIMKEEKNDNEALVRLQRDLVHEIAERFLPLYKSSGGKLGYVSIQGDPFQEDKDSILRFARYHCTAPNIMAKIPAIPSGFEAIGPLVAEGVPLLLTECFAVRQVIDACEVYIDAIKSISNPAPMYFALITGIYDEYLQNHVEEKQVQIDRDALWQAGFSIAKKIHEIVEQRQYPCKFMGGGARGLHHFTEMVGANASITINWKGAAEELIKLDLPVVNRFSQPTPHEVIDELTEKLDDYRKAYYINAIKPEDYEDFGPVALFRKMFEDAWKKAVSLVASLR
ncbi:MAG: hypothetical protein LBD23_00970 [Oscillospiraceae bacterium]|nr:hypothetical protein [Oscillospiraceae bacterium]